MIPNPATAPLAWLLAALLAGGVPALAEDSIRVVEVRTVPSELAPVTQHPTHELRLFLYAFRGTRWAPEDVARAAQEAARLIAQCGVALAGAELRLVAAPRRFHFLFTPVSAELLRRIEVPKPAVFFVEDTHNRPAFDAEAIGLENSASRPELANTVWVAHGARDLAQALAHELVHVLSDSGEHAQAPGNLMRPETSPENTRLTDSQCERLRLRGEENGLLVRR